MIAFQTIGISFSVIVCLHSITVNGEYLLNLPLREMMAVGTLFSVSVYTVQALTLYLFARRDDAHLKLAAIALSVLTFVLIIWRLATA